MRNSPGVIESTVDGTGGRTPEVGDAAYSAAETAKATANAIFAGKVLKRFTVPIVAACRKAYNRQAIFNANL